MAAAAWPGHPANAPGAGHRFATTLRPSCHRRRGRLESPRKRPRNRPAVGWAQDATPILACARNARGRAARATRAPQEARLSALHCRLDRPLLHGAGDPLGLGDWPIPDRCHRQRRRPGGEPVFCRRPTCSVLAAGPDLQPAAAVFCGPTQPDVAARSRIAANCYTHQQSCCHCVEQRQPFAIGERVSIAEPERLAGGQPLGIAIRQPECLTVGKPVGLANTYAYPYSYSHADAYSNTHAHAYSYAYSYAHAYSDAQANSDAYPHADADTHANKRAVPNRISC